MNYFKRVFKGIRLLLVMLLLYLAIFVKIQVIDDAVKVLARDSSTCNIVLGAEFKTEEPEILVAEEQSTNQFEYNGGTTIEAIYTESTVNEESNTGYVYEDVTLYQQPSYAVSIDDVLVKKCCSDEFYEAIKAKWINLPSSVQLSFLNDGWTMIVTDEDISNTYLGGKYPFTHGATFYGERVIRYYNSLNSLEVCFYHEIGHYIDYKKAGFGDVLYSSYQEWKNVFDEERIALKFIGENPLYILFEPEEYFAGVFQQVVCHPDTCKSTAPKSYAIVKDYLNSI